MPVIVSKVNGETLNGNSIDLLRLKPVQLEQIAELMDGRVEYRKFHAVYTPADELCNHKGCWRAKHSDNHSRTPFPEAERRKSWS